MLSKVKGEPLMDIGPDFRRFKFQNLGKDSTDPLFDREICGLKILVEKRDELRFKPKAHIWKENCRLLKIELVHSPVLGRSLVQRHPFLDETNQKVVQIFFLFHVWGFYIRDHVGSK